MADLGPFADGPPSIRGSERCTLQAGAELHLGSQGKFFVVVICLLRATAASDAALSHRRR